MPSKTGVLAEAVRRAARRPSRCIEWTGFRNACGYGWAGRLGLAHRVVYERVVGPIPASLTLDHLCRNRACVNPVHLEPVTHQVNIRRGARAQATHCLRGHPYDEANTRHRKGRRDCITCDRWRARRWRAKAAAA